MVVVSISGCTSTGDNSNPSEDIYLQQQNPPYVLGDEAYVNAWITTKSGKSYSNITLMATGFNNENQVIGEKKVYVAYLDNQYQSTGFEVKFPNTVNHITIKVLNATIEK
jgi:hypothetical protein